MAEQVQAVLDQMVAPMQDWQSRGIFTRDEIHAMVHRRRNGEYDLRRRQPRQADFLRYIAHEVQLERLRELRTQAWQQRQKQEFQEQKKKLLQQLKQQQGGDDEAGQVPAQIQQQQQQLVKPPRLYGFLGDKHVIQHIHYLWKRTLSKYKSNVALYLEYAEFCKTHKCLNRLSSLYAEALQLHPNQVGLWIEAASHEFFYSNDDGATAAAAAGISNARILLQRAIRLHPTSQDLWLQLFTLELHFIQKLEGRKQILLGLAGGKRKKKSTTTESDPDDEDKQGKQQQEEEDLFQICRIVFQNAISAVTKENNKSINIHNKTNIVTFACRFWDTCRLFPATQSLQKWIVDQAIIPKAANINKNLDGSAILQESSKEHDPQAWLAWALYVWDVEQREQKPKSTAAAAAVDESSEEENDANEEEGPLSSEPRPKKPRCNDQDKKDVDDQEDDHDINTSLPRDVVSILDLAIRTLPTPDMYLKAIRMMLRYVEYLYVQKQQQQRQVEEEEEEEDHLDSQDNGNNLIRATRWVATTFQKAATIDKSGNNTTSNSNGKLYTSDMVLEHVDFLTRTTESSTLAIQVLRDFVHDSSNNQGGTTTTTTTNIHAKVWVRLASLLCESGHDQSEDGDDNDSNSDHQNGQDEEKGDEKMRQGHAAAIEILKQALKAFPMTRKEHLGMLLHLFGAKLEAAAMCAAATASNQNSSSDDVDAELFPLFQRILLLAPGFVSGWQGGNSVALSKGSSDKDNVDVDDDMMLIAGKPAFGIGSVTDACLLYLQHAYHYHDDDDDGMQAVRKVYRAVLYESSILNVILCATTTRQQQQRHDDDEDNEHAKVAAFVEQAIQMEREASTSGRSNSRDTGRRRVSKENKKHLHRLYDAASKLFGKSALGDRIRQRRNEDLLYDGSTSASAFTPTSSIPHFDAALKGFSPNDFISAFGKYQVVHVSNIASWQRQSHCHEPTRDRQMKNPGYFSWKSIAGLFERLDEKDKASWCIETPLTSQDGKTAASCSTSTPGNFLQPRIINDRGYCSFLVQKDQDAYRETLQCLPVCDLPSGTSSDGDDGDDTLAWQYDSPGALWIFFGRNINNVTSEGSASLKGRPEHTDSISTDGTWHYQLAGQKTWCLRPTGTLLRHIKHHLSLKEAKSWTASTRVNVECRKGDVIVINTSLWFHATNIPSQSAPSVSYARDFFLRRLSGSSTGSADASQKRSSSSSGMTMTNLDGLYANCDIEEDTVIFRESEMPDCELHRSSVDPNCEVVELEDGTNAVISKRPIAAGEFFSVAESSSEEEDDDDDGEDDHDGEHL